MGQRADCIMENICPIERNDAGRCCVALISSQDLIADGINQGLGQHDSIFLQDHFNDYSELLAST